MRMFFVGLTLILLTVVPVMAQDPDTVVHTEGFLGWLRPYAVELLGLIIAAAVSWATKRFHDLTGIQIESKHREALQSALRNGANLVIDKLPVGGPIDVKSPAIATAIRYVLESVPDAVEYFGLTPEKIAELLKPKLATAPVMVMPSETT